MRLHKEKPWPKDAFRVCLFGASLDNGNLGVQALAASLIRVILDSRPDAEICFFYGSRNMPPPQEVTVLRRKLRIYSVHFRLSPKAKLQEHLLWIVLMAALYRMLPVSSVRRKILTSHAFIKKLVEADFVGDIRGGDSFSDIYGLGRLLKGTLPLLPAFILGKELVLLPQTYGPFKSKTARQIARFTMNFSSRIFARDHDSAQIAHKLLKHKQGREVELCPDVAFMLEAVTSGELEISPPLPRLRSGNPLVGINVNGLIYNGGYTKNNMFGLKLDYRTFIFRLITELCEQTDARILLVPHTTGSLDWHVESDPSACKEALQALPENYKRRIHLVTGSYDQGEIKGIIARCDFFIGSRMHSCIAALSQGIPTVGVAYSRKFKGVFESIGAGELVVEARSTETDAAVERVMELFQSRGRATDLLNSSILSAKNKITHIFNDMLCPLPVIAIADQLCLDADETLV